MTGPRTLPEFLEAYLSFSLLHIPRSSATSSSHDRCISKVSKVSRKKVCTFISRPLRKRSFTVATNLTSMFREKVCPGLSMRMRMSMIALY